MQLTIELEPDEIATYAHLAKILDVGKEGNIAKMGSIYPLPVVMAMNDLLNSFDDLLEGMDSPFEVGDNATKHTTYLAHRMQQISETLLEMKAEFDERRSKQ